MCCYMDILSITFPENAINKVWCFTRYKHVNLSVFISGEASFQESKLNINRDSLAHCPHIYLCTYVVYCTPTSPGIPSDQLTG